MQTGQRNRAERLMEKTIEQHPTYILGFSNKLQNLETEEEAKKYMHLLGEPRDIRTIKPNQEFYHIQDFVTYTACAAQIECLLGDRESAVDRLEQLMELEQDRHILRKVATNISMMSYRDISKRMEESRNLTVSAEHRVTYGLNLSAQRPPLQHSELEIFYQYSESEIDVEQVKAIFNQYGEALISDLLTILDDNIRKSDEYYDRPEWDEKTSAFTVHALYCLGALKQKETLQNVLNQFRAGEEHCEFWFSDYIGDYFSKTLYLLGESQLEVLEQFIQEPYILGWHKAYVIDAVEQVAHHQLERRAEVLDWLKRNLEFFRTHRNDKTIFDTIPVTSMVGAIVNIRGIELLNLVEELYAKNWVDPMVFGDLETVKAEIKMPLEAYDKKEMPLNLEEFYTKAYEQRQAKYTINESFERLEETTKPQSRAEKLIDKMSFANMLGGLGGNDFDDDSYQEPPQQKKSSSTPRPKAKVGRNDPCHCGSGKKYKKCCLKKDREMA
jgi:uncharacterized protein YecA (UPF0149 family)